MSIKIKQHTGEVIDTVQDYGSSAASLDAFNYKSKPSVKNKEIVNYEDSTYKQKPTVKNQLFKYPESCRLSAIETLIFDLSDADQLKVLNEYQTLCQNPDNGILIQHKDEQFYEGKWLVKLTIQKIEFANLLK